MCSTQAGAVTVPQSAVKCWRPLTTPARLTRKQEPSKEEKKKCDELWSRVSHVQLFITILTVRGLCPGSSQPPHQPSTTAAVTCVKLSYYSIAYQISYPSALPLEKLITGPSYYYGFWTNLVLQEASVNVSCTLATASISNKRERRNATSPAARRCLRRIIRRAVLTTFLTSKASERFLPTLPSPICRIPLFPSSSSTFLTNRFKIFEASNPTAPLAIALGPQKDPAYMHISGRPL